MTWILIAVCGGLGAVGRYVMEQYLKGSRGWSPLSTVSVINLLGGALLGLLTGIIFVAVEAQPQTVMVPAAVSAAAVCGGFTTFSTAMVEEVKRAWGMWNSIASLVFNLLFCVLTFGLLALIGTFLGSLIFQVPYFPV